MLWLYYILGYVFELLYYIFIWPFRLLLRGLVDGVLVRIGLKSKVSIGSPVWRRQPLRAALARWRGRRAARRSRSLPRAAG